MAARGVSWLEPVGTIWVSAIRMTVIPLILSALIVAVAGAAPATVGRLGTRAFAVFVLLLIALAIPSALLVPPIFGRLTIDAAAAQTMRAAAAAAPRPPLPTFASWLVDLVPTNVFHAAAEGAMLPLLVFTLAFGLAVGRIAADARRPVVDLFRGIADAMSVLVRWILALAPVGVFALATVLATKLGAGVIGAVGFYLVVISGLLLASMVSLYLAVGLFSRVRVGAFARAAAPGQIVALTTRSSMAALPAMLTAAEESLGLPRTVTSFAMPLAVSTFRYVQPLTWQCYAAFAAALYGVHLGIADVATLAVASVLMSFSVPGIPFGGLYVIAPVLPAIGIPAEAVGVLIAVDLIPDLFKSLSNSTAHLAAVALTAGGELSSRMSERSERVSGSAVS
ncbi:MAG: sodium:dicarboxylate symporter [Gemmatimonadetes bacterium]|nr:sodium:dicarboxylate symporter [Gemmatimonadota bacterium]